MLVRNGIEVGPELVCKIMLQEGLVACQPRPRPRTTIPATGIQTRPDLVQWDFTAQAPGHKWVGDITYIPTWDGHAYLATVMDCYSRKIIGYAIASHMRTSLITQALDMATRNCPTEPGHTIFHSDKGS
ncbi:DDE-type integrase/transposase/recombinase [Actinomyces respiraculi]|uniref:DDE-type integrase/transposase/recombinase n=2 Tax=Actinomyces respiraculi TaxID=2744574 RepID=UPI00142040F9|nr:DDE-type integrase/transposase/recombinase [Actinomyces respiraculi]